MATISIEVRCDSHEQALQLTEKILNGDHYIGRKHGNWFWFCECPVNEVLNIGKELHCELQS